MDPTDTHSPDLEAVSEKSMFILTDLSLISSLVVFEPEGEVGVGITEVFNALSCLGDLNGDSKPVVGDMVNGVLGVSEGDIIMLGRNESPAPASGLFDVSIVNHRAFARRRPPFPIACVTVVRRRGPATPILRRCRSTISSRWSAHSPLTTKIKRLIIT